MASRPAETQGSDWRDLAGMLVLVVGMVPSAIGFVAVTYERGTRTGVAFLFASGLALTGFTMRIMLGPLQRRTSTLHTRSELPADTTATGSDGNHG